MSYIELNGKHYDARTGKLIKDLSSSNQPTQQKTVQKTINNTSGSQLIDGFKKPQKHVAQHQTTHHQSQQSAPNQDASPQSLAVKQPPKPQRASVNHANRQADRSKTLMRKVTKKPAIKASSAQKPEFKPKNAGPSHQRVSRAEATQKSQMISKFGKVGIESSIKKSVQSLPIAKPPAHHKIHQNNSHHVNELEKFENAIKNATSHLQKFEQNTVKKLPFLKRVGFKNQFANLATITAGFLLLVGFFAYQNAAQLSVRVASARSGVSASMPGYVPAGYSASPNVKTESGKISISFTSNSDQSRNFTLTEQASNWNSNSLLANYVEESGCNNCHQTWQNDGKTVYIYDNNATWVDGGIWYTIEGNAQLTSDQLLRLASSL